MISKVSDFRLAEAILRSICREERVKFVDVCVALGEDNISSDCLFVGKTKNIGHTIYKIVDSYINSSYIVLISSLFVNIDFFKIYLIYLIHVILLQGK